MEEEVCYSNVFFTKSEGAKPREELNVEETIYNEVKKKEVQAECSPSPATEGQNAEEEVYAEVDKKEVHTDAGPSPSLATDDQSLPSSHRYCCALVVLGLLTALLLSALVAVVVYYRIFHMSEYNTLKALYAHASAANQHLHSEVAQLQQKKTILMMERDHLNQTLEVIFQFNNFPVDQFCPVTDSLTQVRRCRRHCKEGFIHFQSSCYLFDYSWGWKTWEDSKTDCGKRGAHLVIIDTIEEQTFINNHTTFYHDQWHGYWIGLSKIQDKWQWVNGSELTGGYWLGTEHRNCVASMPSTDPSKSWFDKWCGMRNRWICEMEAAVWPD